MNFHRYFLFYSNSNALLQLTPPASRASMYFAKVISFKGKVCVTKFVVIVTTVSPILQTTLDEEGVDIVYSQR